MLQEASDLDQSSNQDEEVMFVYAIGSSCVKADKQFYKFVKVEDTKVCFQLDSCAKANVMSRSTYQNLKCRPLKPLKTTNTVLISISDHKLKLCGEVMLQARYIKMVADVKFFVVEPDVESVLSGNMCQTWPTEENLPASQQPVSRVELDDYLELFNGLGCLPGTYPIELSMMQSLWYICQGRYESHTEGKILKNLKGSKRSVLSSSKKSQLNG